MNFEKQSILSSLQELDIADPQKRIFGSIGHRYKLAEPVRLQAVREIESKFQIKFPEDYVQFVGEIGNGGAGPYWGVFPFGKILASKDFEDWANSVLVGNLSKPFKHVAAFNADKRTMWKKSVMDGAIPICEKGCALRIWLVVNGSQAGFVWGDDRADEKGIYPLLDSNGHQQTFSQWYVAWLQTALSQAAGKAQ